MKNQQVTEERPVLFGDYIGQIELQLYRIAVFGELQPAGDSDDVGVAGDGRDAEGVAEHDVGGLAAHARQRHKLFYRVRDFAAEGIDNLATGPLDAHRFVVIETTSLDVFLDLPEVRVGPIGG